MNPIDICVSLFARRISLDIYAFDIFPFEFEITRDIFSPPQRKITFLVLIFWSSGNVWKESFADRQND